jgi:dethiobiotin synthetase
VAGGLFVTGTGTGVGKTVLAAAIVAALRARKVGVRALKPLITGLDERSNSAWPPDHELLARAAGCPPDEVALVGFGPAVSPHLAAELAQRPINPAALIDRVRAARNRHDALIVEGVGGLLVPIARDFDVRRLAAELGLPLVIAARAGLGTINHTLLTLEAARAAGLEPIAVVLTPWPQEPDEIERSNRATIEDRGDVPVFTLPLVERPEPALLAEAAAGLPLDRWLARGLR